MEAIKIFKGGGTEERVLKILADLRFLAKIKKGKKVNLNPRSIDDDNIITSAYRTFYARTESRSSAFEFAKDVFSNAMILLCDKLSDDEALDSSLKVLVVAEMRRAIVSVKELCGTYSNDTEFNSRIEVEMELFEMKIKHIKLGN